MAERPGDEGDQRDEADAGGGWLPPVPPGPQPAPGVFAPGPPQPGVFAPQPAPPPPGAPPPAGAAPAPPPPGFHPPPGPQPPPHPATPPPAYGAWQQPPPPPGAIPAAPYLAPAPPTNGKATAALVLGIAGIVVCPVVCSIAAVIVGYQARNEIDASGGRQEGRSMATTGIILGWIGVALGVLLVIAIVLIAATADLDETMSTLRL